MRRVVITGLGTVNPIGRNVPEFLEGLKEGRLGICEIDRFDASDFDVKVAGEVKDFDPSGIIDKKESRRLDRFTQFAVVAAKEALDDAGSDFSDVDPYRAGVIIGAGFGGFNLTEKEHSHFLEKSDKVSVFYIPMMIANMAAGTVAMKTNFRGDNFATVSACASGTHSVGEAFRKIKDGYLDVALAGGTESAISRFALAGFNSMKALTKEADPTKASRPFDAERSGFVFGEGCGVLVLEEYEHAKARGAKIYAEIAGYGATCDAYHMTSPSPTGEAAAEAIRQAYTEAGLKPEDIDYINAHGTSTHLNDAYETIAIKKALGEDAARKTVINSTKSMTGHLLGGAGAVEAVATALQIKEGFIHQTLGYSTPDPECDLDYCTEGRRDREVRAALSNSLGFGGHNGTICLKKVTD
ncbi:3-oxoacyl-[acyl-carrier-protein] synthase II [Ruminococcus sp. YE71]|uniref:beta-ketoacyl-ACP synthase II n=1 Tax=unclassified Ruminococcus TaxID=2608920 RepID=UPI000885E20E|nr:MULTISPECIES: beta-ketoacyl-ACP synthase II [unclassified Ruminococcus]SDA17183.1 3-oxoacyl-[acyl-carrier-protein] synthase II [Ruminococcus sp. YE78]SFW26421.1 3-oxoacyl-[acyl-carrier-protein] synthase II [Ruminococcus sp. YE71]